ncbi:DUF4177 domain-containing protein [Sediminicola arcticus]|jgi:hypothetical protein|uniref:DUF4177 domain-containing protein n=1 Tax=Sediminicola arcticus TaxID=1574308 RepID=A0ABV2SXG5_9FLAO
MKEYKIVKQKGKVFGNSDQEFEDELNSLAKEGWKVISVCGMTHSTLVKAYLERDKFR